MRDALLTDLQALGVHCITSHDHRVPAPKHATSVPVDAQTGDIFTFWQHHIQQHPVDACWVIAPEADGVLQQMHALVSACGLPWVGCDATAIQLSTDKRAMAAHCAAHGIPVLPHIALAAAEADLWAWQADPATLGHRPAAGWIVKPWDGAGCEHTYHFKQFKQVIDLKKLYEKENPALLQRQLVQPFQVGQALSFSAIATASAVHVVAVHAQRLALEGSQLQFAGANVNAASQYWPVMQTLAAQLKAAMPGLIGYWGADVVMAPSGQLTVVDINPRLTTPYIALSGLLPENPAAMILQAVFDQRLPRMQAQGQQTLQLGQLLQDSPAPAHSLF